MTVENSSAYLCSDWMQSLHCWLLSCVHLAKPLGGLWKIADLPPYHKVLCGTHLHCPEVDRPQLRPEKREEHETFVIFVQQKKSRNSGKAKKEGTQRLSSLFKWGPKHTDSHRVFYLVFCCPWKLLFCRIKNWLQDRNLTKFCCNNLLLPAFYEQKIEGFTFSSQMKFEEKSTVLADFFMQLCDIAFAFLLSTHCFQNSTFCCQAEM